MADKWYVKSADGNVYGPTDLATLVVWAKEGRVEPTGFVSRDRKEWIPAQLLPELEMKWVVEAEPGKFFGPFNRAVVVSLQKAGSIPEGASLYRCHELPADQDPPPQVVEKIVEKVVEVPVEVEKVVEKVVEVEPKARTAVVDPEVVEAVAERPPQPVLSGIFKGVDRSRLEALEAAARRELAAAKRGGLGGIFSRRKS